LGVGRWAFGAARRLRGRNAVLLLVCAAACGSGSEPNLALGEIRGSWAGSAWHGDVGGLLVQRRSAPDTMEIIAARPRGSFTPTEEVIVKVEFTGTGTYTLNAGAAEFRELVGDVVLAKYIGTGGTLTIDSYTGPDGTVEGSFSFDATSTDASRSYGDAARFENGRFRAQVVRSNPTPVPM
jgi:hypothetical protein